MISKTLPWYRHRWPWFLMLGPTLAALACGVTIWLAYDHSDSSVALDYYKRGLAVDQDIYRQQRATELSLSAQIQIAPSGMISAQLQGKALAKALPPELTFKLAHPTQSGHDRSVILYRQGLTDHYQSRAVWDQSGFKAKTWYVTLETKEWRLDSVWRVDSGSEISIKPRS